jgi:2'-5' RNA ligase
MSPHFNIALYPQSPSLANSLIELAEKNLRGQTDKYLLGKQVLPHISLSQFVCERDVAQRAWEAMDGLAGEPLSLQFSHIYILAGAGILHQGKNWVGISVVPTQALIDLQKSVCQRLNQLGIDSLTSRESYFPHLTFGRLAKACAITISGVPERDFWQKKYQFEMSLGRSNEIGVYIERLN